MTIHDPLPPDHDVIVRHFYKARCSCGWVGYERDGVKPLAADLARHIDLANTLAAKGPLVAGSED